MMMASDVESWKGLLAEFEKLADITINGTIWNGVLCNGVANTFASKNGAALFNAVSERAGRLLLNEAGSESLPENDDRQRWFRYVINADLNTERVPTIGKNGDGTDANYEFCHARQAERTSCILIRDIIQSGKAAKGTDIGGDTSKYLVASKKIRKALARALFIAHCEAEIAGISIETANEEFLKKHAKELGKRDADRRAMIKTLSRTTQRHRKTLGSLK